MSYDLKGRPWATVQDTGAGSIIETDHGSDCWTQERYVVEHDGGLFFRCTEGKHYLDGQLSDDGTHYIGIYLANT